MSDLHALVLMVVSVCHFEIRVKSISGGQLHSPIENDRWFNLALCRPFDPDN